MKHFIIALIILAAAPAFGQKQKDMQAQIDTLKKNNDALKLQNQLLKDKADSTSKQCASYLELYNVLKAKVVKKDFDPARMAFIIDSLKAGRDSLKLASAAGVMTNDSLKNLRHTIDSLRKETEGLMYAVNLLKGGSGSNPVEVTDFKGVWNLTLRKVKIIGQAPRGGIIDVSAEPVAKTASPLELNPVASINFVDAEFAELTFRNGDKAKVMYEIVEFSKTKPYYIEFKGTKAEFRLHFMNTSSGPRISFQVPGAEGVYFFGQITK